LNLEYWIIHQHPLSDQVRFLVNEFKIANLSLC